MKKRNFLILFLVLAIITPIVFTAIVTLNNEESMFELIENSPEEEKNEQEAEDILDEFLNNNFLYSTISSENDLLFLEKPTTINAINREVLTPPPELI